MKHHHGSCLVILARSQETLISCLISPHIDVRGEGDVISLYRQGS